MVPLNAVSRSQEEILFQQSENGERLRTLEHGLAVLDYLSAAGGGCQLSAIARSLSLSAGATHRILRTLVACEYVEQDPRTRRYELGLKVLELSGSNVRAMHLASDARPLLQALMRQSGLSTRLAVYRSRVIVYVDRIDSEDMASKFMTVGSTAPAYATGLGKALLAYQSDQEIDRVLREPLLPITQTTITDPEVLLAELASVRELGYALDRGESQELVHCVAAPVVDGSRKARAAVSVAGRPHVVDAQIRQLAELVMATARAISTCPADEVVPSTGGGPGRRQNHG